MKKILKQKTKFLFFGLFSMLILLLLLLNTAYETRAEEIVENSLIFEEIINKEEEEVETKEKELEVTKVVQDNIEIKYEKMDENKKNTQSIVSLESKTNLEQSQTNSLDEKETEIVVTKQSDTKKNNVEINKRIYEYTYTRNPEKQTQITITHVPEI